MASTESTKMNPDLYKTQRAEAAQNYVAVAKIISTNVNKSWHLPLRLELCNACSQWKG